MHRLLTELLGFVMSAGFYDFLQPHSSGCFNDRIAWFCHKTNFFSIQGKPILLFALNHRFGILDLMSPNYLLWRERKEVNSLA